MSLEIIFNAVLILFFIYAYFFIGIGAPENEPKLVDGVEWPRMILILLIGFMLINLYKLIKDRKNGQKDVFKLDLKELVKNKLFMGSVLLLVYSLALDYTGFIVSSVIAFGLYSYLLGERKIPKIAIVSVLVIVFFYVVFSYGLDIMLPRGAGIFRTFALFLESI